MKMSLLLLRFLFFFLLFLGTPIRAEPKPSQSQQTGLHLELNSASQLPTWGTAFIDLESGVRDESNSVTEEENTIAQAVFRSIGAFVSALRGKKKKRDRKKSTSIPADLSEWPYGEEDVIVAASNTRRSPAVTKKIKNDKLKVNEIANPDCLRCIPWTRELKSATEYHKKGIFLKRKKLGIGESIFDISFSSICGILHIPKLSVNDDTLTMLQSERTKSNQKVTAYVQFWACLARETKDVDLLSEEGIISINHKSFEEVVVLIRNMHKELGEHKSESYLEPIYQQLDKCCDNKIRKWLVQSIIRKFNICSILKDVFITSLTILSVTFAVLKYLK